MARLPEGFVLLQVTPRLDGGGVERVTLDTARAVVAAGARALIATAGGAMEPEARASGAEVVRLSVDAKDPVRLAANGLGLARLARRTGASLIHVRSRAPAFSALIAGRLAGVPVVATYHGIYSSRSGAKRWYNSVMTRGVATFANSEFTRDHVLQEHRVDPGRVIVAPEGVDVARFDPAAISPDRAAALRAAWRARPDQPVVLQAARLTSWKGQALAIRAFAAAQNADALLVLVGRVESPAFARELQETARAAGVVDRVRFAGPVDDMPAALLAADVVLAPSTKPESFGRSVAEAGAMERLVIASDLGAVRETLDGGAGWLVASGDGAAWSQAIAAALALEAGERRAVGRRARERIAARFSLDAMTEATFAAYARLARRAG
ncbi:MAG TPA: glycosyltransferase [Caulobacteraceae bacterium]|jgi:glycosyltransferase involved in cell wall biosynthesis|nr:glycosyltransferase [Caulobacteraceae bacterium]